MYKVTKKLEVSAAHNLSLPYDSACNGLHGHNWFINIEVASKVLNKNGMVVDFTDIKRRIHGQLDHTFLNDILDFETTAENMTGWVRDQINDLLKEQDMGDVALCSRVEIFETEGNSAIWETNIDLRKYMSQGVPGE